ncbi:hypothetical protein AFLA_006113 [Aspergillus flavus NRRL3357]|nr:hypothetical protein AFLA_006113 [Aspergillus flavus NRRL3357]
MYAIQYRHYLRYFALLYLSRSKFLLCDKHSHAGLQHIPKLSKLKSRLPTHQSKSPPREALSLPPDKLM